MNIISDTVNTAVNDVAAAIEDGPSDQAQDLLNLVVNVVVSRLTDDPHATIEHIIETNYENDPATVLSWIAGV